MERKDTRGDIEAGKAVYEKYCRYCHGEKGLGDGVVATALTPHPADFVNDAIRMSKSDEELLKSITDGIRRDIGGEALSMPAWKSILTEKERHDVLAYVRKLEREGRKGAVKAVH
ncbi:MAG: cytochrome c [Deltaproteobacteria bacterium]|nr:cytochrome c [Deltaproteobacteria bacterium]